MDGQWLELLVKFFEAHSEPLGEIFDADGCREGWLHGELFRCFRFRHGFNSFKVNSLRIGVNRKADFSVNIPLG